VDPLGAILISLVIIYRWGNIMSEQVKKIVGHTAPPDFIIKVVHYSRLDSKEERNSFHVYLVFCQAITSFFFKSYSTVLHHIMK
jgi:divalent metal cation (Fe/Co/Zn/Cd) transporter